MKGFCNIIITTLICLELGEVIGHYNLDKILIFFSVEPSNHNIIIADVTPITKGDVCCYHAKLATESNTHQREDPFMKGLLSTNCIPAREVEMRV